MSLRPRVVRREDALVLPPWVFVAVTLHYGLPAWLAVIGCLVGSVTLTRFLLGFTDWVLGRAERYAKAIGRGGVLAVRRGGLDLRDFGSAQAFCCPNTPMAARGDGWYPTTAQAWSLVLGAIVSAWAIPWVNRHLWVMPWKVARLLGWTALVAACAVVFRYAQGLKVRERREVG